MTFLKHLLGFFLILLCHISCDLIIPHDENENFDWSEGDYAFIDMESYPEWESGIITKEDNDLYFTTVGGNTIVKMKLTIK